MTMVSIIIIIQQQQVYMIVLFFFAVTLNNGIRHSIVGTWVGTIAVKRRVRLQQTTKRNETEKHFSY